MNKKLIVFDVELPPFKNNRILDSAYASQFPGASVIPCLRNIARKADWDMMTADVFLSRHPGFSRAVCLSNEATSLLPQLIKAGVEPKVLNSGESPNVAWKFYHNLPEQSRLFKYSCLFHGIKERCSTGNFEHFYWPCNGRKMAEGLPWNQRSLLCMIVSSKARNTPNWASWRSRLFQPVRIFKQILHDRIDPFLKVEDLNEIRLQAIEVYAEKSEFRLFGKGWDAAIKHWPRFKNVRFVHKPQACKDKLQIMENYKFALCFENCAFPGYITEKIFDGFFAGCVPVYLGAPDITDYVRQECFIDFHRFTSFAELWDYIQSMTHTKWKAYRENIREFLASESFKPFKDTTIAEKYFGWLTN
ncbi:MAG: hypothetical protein JW715_14685 [Sedimentisphaerales bacterium]|nr:hypothetical protein [Sedimentisphaerales bacterium]